MDTQNCEYAKLGALLKCFEIILFSFSNFGQSKYVGLQIRLVPRIYGYSKVYIITFCRCSKFVGAQNW